MNAYRTEWDSECMCYIPIYAKNEQLEAVYRMLREIGYRISTEETNYMLGNLPQYQEAQDLADRMKKELEAEK